MAGEQETTEVVDGAEQTPKGPTLEELQKANASKDRVIALLQEGRELPKWARDAGVESREQFESLLKKPAREPEPEPEELSFDPTKYLDDDGRMTVEGHKKQAEYLSALARKSAQDQLNQARYDAAMEAERLFIAKAGETAPEALVGEDGDRDIITAALDGLVSRSTKDDEFVTQDKVQAQMERFKGYIDRLVEKEIARRAQAAKEAADDEPPAHGPKGGEGQPHAPKAEEKLTPQQQLQRDREASRKAYLERHKR